MSAGAMQIAQNREVRTERRAHERLPVALMGRALMPNGLEIPCQATDISPGDVGLVASFAPVMNDQVVVYLDHVGRLAGHVARIYEAGFALKLDVTPRKKEKLEARIEWLRAHDHFGVEDQRGHKRIEPRQDNTQIILQDGRKYDVEIIDISISGAALQSAVRPAIGTRLTVAGMSGVVVRHFTEGMAIEFDATADALPLS
ncbi:MAG: PilZ domain-containing protein [Pseudomonadota bacterium]